MATNYTRVCDSFRRIVVFFKLFLDIFNQTTIKEMLLKHFQSSDVYNIPKDWIYRGEGNSNVVISLPETHQILRIRKEEKPKTVLEWFMNWLNQLLKWNYTNEIKKESRDLKFYSVVMRKLLGENFVCTANQVHISRKQIRNLDEKLIKFRPECRKNKRLQCGRATLFQDYAFLPYEKYYLTEEATFSVEIKPKQGWVPYNQRKYPNCPYCMNQYLKLKKGQIQKISSYCPLDLFSGDKKRMLNAIKSLIENPQNNFRIFRNGICVYDENINVEVFFKIVQEWFGIKENSKILLNESCDLIRKILLTTFQSNNGCDHTCFNGTEISKINKNFNGKCDYSDFNLPYGCVLERIISVQKFDTTGIVSNTIEKNIDYWNYVDKLLEEVYYDKNHCPKCVVKKFNYNENNLIYVPYLIAAVARDCSLMLTLKRVQNCDTNLNEAYSIKTKFSTFIINVGIFDLYPKAISVLEKHKKRNELMYKAYLDKVQKQNICDN